MDVVHALDMSNSPLVDASTQPNHAAQQNLRTAREHVQAALQAVPVRWTYDLTDGDAVDALLAAANAHAALMIVVGRPEPGLGAALGHMLTNAVTRTLIRRSPRPVVVVPDVADSLR